MQPVVAPVRHHVDSPVPEPRDPHGPCNAEIEHLRSTLALAREARTRAEAERDQARADLALARGRAEPPGGWERRALLAEANNRRYAERLAALQARNETLTAETRWPR